MFPTGISFTSSRKRPTARRPSAGLAQALHVGTGEQLLARGRSQLGGGSAQQDPDRRVRDPQRVRGLLRRLAAGEAGHDLAFAICQRCHAARTRRSARDDVGVAIALVVMNQCSTLDVRRTSPPRSAPPTAAARRLPLVSPGSPTDVPQASCQERNDRDRHAQSDPLSTARSGAGSIARRLRRSCTGARETAAHPLRVGRRRWRVKSRAYSASAGSRCIFSPSRRLARAGARSARRRCKSRSESYAEPTDRGSSLGRAKKRRNTSWQRSCGSAPLPACCRTTRSTSGDKRRQAWSAARGSPANSAAARAAS